MFKKSYYVYFKIFVIQYMCQSASTMDTNYTTSNFLKKFGKCFASTETGGCLQNEVFGMLDQAINDNRTWIVNNYITFEKDSEWDTSDSELSSKSVDDTFSTKMKNLIESRTLHFQWATNPAEEEFEIDERKGKLNKYNNFGIA